MLFHHQSQENNLPTAYKSILMYCVLGQRVISACDCLDVGLITPHTWPHTVQVGHALTQSNTCNQVIYNVVSLPLKTQGSSTSVS